MTRMLALTLPALALAGCAAPQSAIDDEAEPWQAARVVGEAESCVPLRQIRDTTVRDDRTIDFHMRNGVTYRNVLPTPCPSLGFEESFSYDARAGQLCSSDVITVLRQPIGQAGAGPSCGLGDFVPVEFPES